MIAVGQKLPNATLYEFLNEETEGCAIGPNAFEIDKLVAGKKNRDFCFARRFHTNLLCTTRARLCCPVRCHQSQGR